MGKFKDAWSKRTPKQRAIFVVLMIASVALLILGFLQLGGKNSLLIIAPGVIILDGIMYWKKNKVIAVSAFVIAVLIIVGAVVFGCLLHF